MAQFTLAAMTDICMPHEGLRRQRPRGMDILPRCVARAGYTPQPVLSSPAVTSDGNVLITIRIHRLGIQFFLPSLAALEGYRGQQNYLRLIHRRPRLSLLEEM